MHKSMVVAHAPERDAGLGRRLDAVLGPRGCHVLHDCAWPGAPKHRIDHVVIAPSGIWIVLEDEATNKAVKKAGLQAEGLAASMGGANVRAVVAVAGAEGPPAGRHGVVVAGTAAVIALIADGDVQLRPGEVARLAAVARADLKPKSTSTPTVVADAPVRSYSPTHIETAPAPRPDVELRPAPSKAAPKQREKPKKAPTGRRGKGWLVVVLLVALAAAGIWFVAQLAPSTTSSDDEEVEVEEAAAAPTATLPIGVMYECRHPTTGWSQVITWPGLTDVRAVFTSPGPDRPWTPVAFMGDVAVRDNVVPTERSLVRVQHGDTETTAVAKAPQSSC